MKRSIRIVGDLARYQQTGVLFTFTELLALRTAQKILEQARDLVTQDSEEDLVLASGEHGIGTVLDDTDDGFYQIEEAECVYDPTK